MTTHHTSTYADNCAILVLSCDKYSDLWKPFFKQFFTYWPDCPFPIYLGTNTKSFQNRKVKNIHSHSARDWSTDLLKILENIQEEYLFLWLEDIFPTALVGTHRFQEAFVFMKNTNAHHIHFTPAILPDRTSNKAFGEYYAGAPYRVTGPGFWRKETLEKLLIPGEDPWKFEIMGSYRSSYQEGYYTAMKPLFEFIRVVDKGKIMYEAYKYCMANNIELDTNVRKVVTAGEKVKSDMRSLLFQFVLSIPWKYRLRFMEILRRAVVSY